MPRIVILIDGGAVDPPVEKSLSADLEAAEILRRSEAVLLAEGQELLVANAAFEHTMILWTSK